jgi:hypothetical protein
MADARDKAIAAMQAAENSFLDDPEAYLWSDHRFGAMLDAIPADVLVDLAIERGALVQADVWDRAPSDPDRVRVYYEDESHPADAVPLYRQVTDGGEDG